ncbi:GlsB/YeaQ/YmgE family stress response membrane protein [Actinomadura sp. LD22]|uniref:GlsB/YeaQ/YmgE family stress response membrane protein n=1 Tax=Actinomadura physcomitrii TaxID=2650748 RepID=A0A6I4M9F9_9ACTN|nr:GlsB/YeaQ/YmgE family stress response membrane protein [Actinomadura physcomitrii]MWA00421.1 GlsB/YeaQ/YmgE family stress response membrane protein [Actinomadura physcomitrii]
MSIGGIVSAVVLGAVVGALGRLVVPGRRSMPGWLTVAVGVVAAFAGTGLCAMVGFGASGWTVWATLFQVGVAALGVCLVAALWPPRTRR